MANVAELVVAAREAAAETPRAAVSPAPVDAATALAVVHALVLIVPTALARTLVTIVVALVRMAGGPDSVGPCVAAVFAAGRVAQFAFLELVSAAVAAHGAALLLVELLLIAVIFVVF